MRDIHARVRVIYLDPSVFQKYISIFLNDISVICRAFDVERNNFGVVEFNAKACLQNEKGQNRQQHGCALQPWRSHRYILMIYFNKSSSFYPKISRASDTRCCCLSQLGMGYEKVLNVR